ncbi:TMAO reductase system periplasmic protein TorT [Pseudaminobacter salicylatoxidans]|uniref:TMAO reductase system periplasmic protein TorT n=1 Tax=Pseudaminobacter salicylatoxidans TaxID=93369 RepID=UPI0002D770B1|nr:TMAO reductase system periplasmic protein TorT [Pseudaminobacter salicylatoxidans]
MRDFCYAATAAITVLFSAPSFAADAWAPFDVALSADEHAQHLQYAPLEAATQKWKLCVLVPHLKDSYWVAANYGLVSEAQRLGLALNVYQAGGYDQLPKQVAQFDDCIAGKADAILIAGISEAGLSAKIKEANDRGITTIGLINPLSDGSVSARVTNDQIAMGRFGGNAVKQFLGEGGGTAAAFPGPQGSGWAEQYLSGFRAALDGSTVEVVADKFGETGVSVQLRLVEDTIQAFPDLKAIWGTGPTIEGAVGAVAEAGLSGSMVLVSSYADQSSIDLLKAGEISGFVSDSTVMQARIAVDLAVRVLEKQDYQKLLVVPPTLITKETIGQTDLTTVLAPKEFRPVFAVE